MSIWARLPGRQENPVKQESALPTLSLLEPGVLDVVRHIVDPDFGKSIVELGSVKIADANLKRVAE
jgi:hypothetical protein